MARCAIASITVTATTIALCLRHRMQGSEYEYGGAELAVKRRCATVPPSGVNPGMKHISSRGPYLFSRKAANSA